MVFTGLVSLNDQLQVEPQMASSWDVSTDHMTYTFHLKQGLEFSDGTKLDATVERDPAHSGTRILLKFRRVPAAPDRASSAAAS